MSATAVPKIDSATLAMDSAEPEIIGLAIGVAVAPAGAEEGANVIGATIFCAGQQVGDRHCVCLTGKEPGKKGFLPTRAERAAKPHDARRCGASGRRVRARAVTWSERGVARAQGVAGSRRHFYLCRFRQVCSAARGAQSRPPFLRARPRAAGLRVCACVLPHIHRALPFCRRTTRHVP